MVLPRKTSLGHNLKEQMVFNYFCVCRNIMVDNSRIAGKRTAPKKLIDIKKGFFKVPEEAAGKPQSRDVVPALYRPSQT